VTRSFTLAVFFIASVAIHVCYGQYQQHSYPQRPWVPTGQAQFNQVSQHQPIAAQGPVFANPQQPPAASPQYLGGPAYSTDQVYNGDPVYEPALSGSRGCDSCSSGNACDGSCAIGDNGRRSPFRNLLAGRNLPDCVDCNWGPMYLSLFGGVSFLDNFDTRFTFDNGIMGELGVRETGFSMDDGVASGASRSRYFYRQARVEAEYTYRDNAVGEFQQFTYSDDLSTPQNNDTLVAAISLPAVGSIESSSVVVNFLFDLKPRTVGCLNAYVGGGIGGVAIDGDAVSAGTTFLFDDAAFAFQGIAGVNYPIRDRLDLFTEYRYLGSDNLRVDQIDGAGGITSLGKFRLDTHNVVFGIRILR